MPLAHVCKIRRLKREVLTGGAVVVACGCIAQARIGAIGFEAGYLSRLKGRQDLRVEAIAEESVKDLENDVHVE